MLKTLTLATVLAATVIGLNVVPAAAKSTVAECQALYAQSLNDPQTFRSTRDEYIRCVGNL